MNRVFVLTVFCVCLVGAQQAPLLSSYWVGNWTVQTAGSDTTSCDTTSCCCFTDSVNIFVVPTTGELILNGSVQGSVCNQPVKQDNLDSPEALSFDEEFFSIDVYTFTIGNASDGSGLVITAQDNSVSAPSCSFGLYRATSQLLTDWTVPTAATLPRIAVPYLGQWQFDSSTCDTSSSACCCFVGSANVSADPQGAEWFDVTGYGSVGCRLASSNTLLQDDFPWPAASESAQSRPITNSATTVNGFLVNQDDYFITLQLQPSGGAYTLTFTDITTPGCSMQATQPVPSPVVLGRSSSRAGTYQPEGTMIETAYDFWVNWTNTQRGGLLLNGVLRPVQLLQYNDASDPTLVPPLYSFLTTQQNVSALFSPFASTLTAVAEQYTAGLPFLFAGATIDSLYGVIPNAFGMSPPNSLRALSCASVMAAAGVRTVSVLYTAGDVFDSQAATDAIAAFAAQNIQLLSNDSIAPGQTSGSTVAPLIAKWRQLDPDLLMLSCTAPDPWNILQQLAAANYWPRQVYLPSASALQSTLQEAAAAGAVWLLEGTLASDSWRPDQPGSDPYFGSPAGFAAAYTAATNQTAVSTYVSAVAAGYVLSLAMEAANSLQAAPVLDALRTTNATFWYGTVQFDAQGAPMMNYTCVQLQQGVTRTVGPQAPAAAYVYPTLAATRTMLFTTPAAPRPSPSTRPQSTATTWIWVSVIICLSAVGMLLVVAYAVLRQWYTIQLVPNIALEASSSSAAAQSQL